MRVELAVMFFAVAVPGLVFGLRGVSAPQSVDTDEISVLSLLVAMASSLGPALIAGYLLWRDGALTRAGFVRARPSAVAGYTGLTLGALLGAVFLAGMILAVIAQLAGGDGPTGESPDVSFSAGSVVAVLAIALTAGLSEEAVYRAYAITRMEQAGWPTAALVVPWAAWTAQHLYAGPAALVVVGAVGVPFVWMYAWRRLVWPLMAAHMVYDVAIFVLSAMANDV